MIIDGVVAAHGGKSMLSVLPSFPQSAPGPLLIALAAPLRPALATPLNHSPASYSLKRLHRKNSRCHHLPRSTTWDPVSARSRTKEGEDVIHSPIHQRPSPGFRIVLIPLVHCILYFLACYIRAICYIVATYSLCTAVN